MIVSREPPELVALKRALGRQLAASREAAEIGQQQVAHKTGYSRSSVAHAEAGRQLLTREFWKTADELVKADGALLAEYERVLAAKQEHELRSREAELAQAYAQAQALRAATSPSPIQGCGEVVTPSGPEILTGLLVEYDDAELSYDGRTCRATMRRKLLNCGEEPITRYLIRISVDRYPGSPEQSNKLYRNDPLTWDELHLQAWHDGEPMTWQIRHDRDAFKELWLLFENDQARFPLYPGESTELEPSVWGMETSMSAQALPFRTPIIRTEGGERARFTWTTNDPPLHARYRIEWRFTQPTAPRTDHSDTKPSETMAQLGIVQLDDPLLRQQAHPFALPEEAEDARRVVAELHSALKRVAQAHVFGKGLGIAAPQIGIGRAAAVVRTPGGEIITLLNPQIIDQSDEQDEQYEGCLSFFDVRGKVPRPLCIQIEHQHVDGITHITAFERGVARLVAHEIDHLAGVLYTDHMTDSTNVIPVEQYRGGGQPWQYALEV
jgi:peptide deformylase